MKKYNVAILGATGAVGREMMKVLAAEAAIRADDKPALEKSS